MREMTPEEVCVYVGVFSFMVSMADIIQAKAQHKHQLLIYAIPAALTILSTLIVGIRIFTRRKYLKFIALDDFWIIVALVSSSNDNSVPTII